MGVTTGPVAVECTAATLRAVLCYINSGQTPDIAYDRDDLAEPLIAKVKEAVGDLAGLHTTIISFGKEEDDLRKQFVGVCKTIKGIFSSVTFCAM